MIGLLFLQTNAAAQVEGCPGALPRREWVEAMDAVDSALQALEGTRADQILDEIVYELRCLREPVAPADLGRLARQVSVVAFYQQDVEEMRYWSLLARETLGNTPWPEDLFVPERYFELVDVLEDPTQGRAEGGIDVPKGGGALLDGFLVREPIASQGVQHLLQIADGKGRVVATLWQTGAAFSRDWLTDHVEVLSIPKWYKAPHEPPRDPEAEPVPEPVPVPEPPVPAPEVLPEPVPEPVPTVDRPRRMPAFDGDGRALDCPWKFEPHNVEANGSRVRVNKHVYPVKTASEQTAFKAVLKSCGEYRAARRFARWRAERNKLFSGAADYKDAMIQALLTPEPTREPVSADEG